MARDENTEILCYDKLASVYFNLNDMENCRFYKDKCIKRCPEPESSRVRVFAEEEIKSKFRRNTANRMFGVVF